MDTALKILTLAYHRARGDVRRTRLVGQSRGYHGVGFGRISVGGIVDNRQRFGSPARRRSSPPHLRPCTNAFTRGQPAHGAHLADALEALVHLHSDTIAAVIVEPSPAPPACCPRRRLSRTPPRHLRKHGILLIFDEVITGFGRLGAPFAAEYFGILPDIMSVAKGLTNGSVPMGAAIVRHGVYEGVLDGTSAGIELFHGYTYSGHPLAAAAGMAALNVYEQEGLFTRAASLNDTRRMRSTRSAASRSHRRARPRPHRRDRARAPPGCPGNPRVQCVHRLLRAGRDDADDRSTVALSPPLIVERHHVDQIVETLGRALRRVA